MGKIIWILFSVFFLAFASVGVFGVFRFAEPLFWKKIECAVLSSEVLRTGKHDDRPYDVLVEYRCGADGINFTGNRTRRDNSLFEKQGLYETYNEAEVARQRFLPGTRVNVFYNSQSPTDSIIMLPDLLLPILFTLFSILPFLLKSQFSKLIRVPLTGTDLLFNVKNLAGKLLLFFPIVGTIVLMIFIVIPLGRTLLISQKWREAECEILSGSAIKTESRGKHGASVSFQPDILYQYEVNGKIFKSSVFSAFRFGRERGEIRIILESYQPGMRTKCWIDPNDPQTSVLNTNIPLGKISLYLLVFCFLSAVAMAIRKKLRAATS